MPKKEEDDDDDFDEEMLNSALLSDSENYDDEFEKDSTNEVQYLIQHYLFIV